MPAGTDSLTTPRRLPGTRTSCALLTVLTILLAWPSPPDALGAIVRPAYFALLAWFFWRASRASPALHGTPMRLVRGGFHVLLIGYTISALIQVTGAEAGPGLWVYLRHACEHGALFLLGTTLVAYGVMLFIPQVLEVHRLQQDLAARQHGALQDAETTRSRLEHHLVDADRRAMLGELAASVAHDLRNPLTIVKGTAESLCRKPRDRGDVVAHTAVIQRNIDKANRIIESLIGLARPRASEAQPLAPVDLLREVADLLQVECRRRGVAVEVVDAGARSEPLASDHTLLTQALLNLVLNAVQATPPGGAVRLAARARRADGANRVGFVVADRGTGLPPEQRARVGTPFFTTKAGGTGLGLASCRRIAAELRGGLRLFPRRRGGARAVLLLPLDATDPGVVTRRPATGSPQCATPGC